MDNNKKTSRIKKFLTLRTIGSKLLAAVVGGCLIMAAAILIALSLFSINIVQDFILSRMKTDVRYLEDIIDTMQDGEWHIEGTSLYKGDVLIGDGTEENANLAPFYETEEKTGTFVYAFMKCSDEGLVWAGDSKTGYQQGHFIRVAGSTKGPEGQSIVGTYIDKKVADVLDSEGEYAGAANVAGGQIYCYYRVFKDRSGEVVGAVVAGRSMDAIATAASNASRSIILLIILIILVVSVGILLISIKWTGSVNKVEDYLKRIGSGELPEDRLELNTRDEISEVADSINEMVESLREKKRMGTELSVASDIQSNLLPKIFPPFPGRKDFDIFASMDPAKEVGGDFYDFFMTDSDHLAIVIADVSGKGVPAALFMVTAKTLIKDQGMLGLDAAEVFTRANALMCESNDTGLFVTGWMGIIELSTGKVNYVNAGHNPPVICHNGECYFLRGRHGFVLAGMSGISYKSQELQLDPDDFIFLYTDGVTESINSSTEMYGENRLLRYVSEHSSDSMEELCAGVRGSVEEYAGDEPQFDDVTMIGFRYRGGSRRMRELTVEASVNNIPVITDFVDAELDLFGCEMKQKMQIDVAIDEIASNISLYAYKGNVGYIKVLVEEADDPDYVMISFIDGGMPYNPLDNADPDVSASLEDRKIGGLGIFIVRKTMDDVKYRFHDGKNMLTLIKKIK